MDDIESAQREKMSTLGELAAVLAHEIKNPMNSIIINIETLRSCIAELAKDIPDTHTAEKANRYLTVIEEEMKRLGKVITGFLDLAAPHEQTKAKINFNSLIKSLMEFMRLELRQKGVKIRLDLNEHLPDIVGSSDQVRQALINLIINATQAMPDGGQISISTNFDAKKIFINVSDTGSGIDTSIMDQIFSPYFTTKEKGSGLGLAIVRRIVREHGGYVDVKSEPKEGTEFSLVFPRSMEGI
ncbi:MAG: hypothetical protein COV44_09545 [Deltaproteobacteria bacterium CG11_big_fil_rev_8_21_14_0_20_45_16]|nr:MAG: hypothetical protein COV44_09545 [Deltaproteobacteria bacterium CG11_big_fil_rev_8_21_14_0_20_45_16]